MQRRTHVLRLIISLFVLAAFLVSCAPPTQEAVVEQATATTAPTQPVVSASTATLAPTLPPPSKYKESPDLTYLVDKGALPPIEERLPENPKVVQPAESVGVYGGVIRRLIKPSADTALFTRTIEYVSLVTWTPDWAGIQPDIAESFEVSEDATTFTFHLRKGMKWSDGAPYTSADLKYWWEDMVMNDDLTPAKPGWLKINGELPEVTFPDDYTVVFKWNFANGLFLSRLATPDGLGIAQVPAHWAKQFHTAYGDKAQIDAWVKEGQFEQWRDFYNDKMNKWKWVDRPMILAWYMTAPYVGGASQVTFERNPYYWKVDTEGQQLPYTDKAIFRVVDSVDAMVPMALNGEVDMQERHIATDANKPLFIDNMEKGDYRLFTNFSGSLNRMSIMFNMNHQDAVKREIFNNIDFRIA
jgi:peptide/nickel transport system substrate-binding protein